MYILKLRILIVIIFFSFMFVSCLYCKECIVYNSEGLPLGTEKLCGADLKKAEKDTVHYKCE